jgi:hypothetical protein
MPRKNTTIEREPKHEAKPTLKMRAPPNWETVNPDESDNPDKMHIPASMVPEGYAFQWVTESVLGQPFAQHRASFEKKGWTPVHQDDFDGQLDGMFMPRGAPGEIKMTGTVLMVRPKGFNIKAKRQEVREAREQVAIKEAAWQSGDLGTTLDSQHPSAINSNRIKKSVERLVAPED